MPGKKRYHLYILSLLGCLPALAMAQVNNFSFTNYTTANGLCCNRVNDVLQDSRGFMWFATAEGLSRFDGTNFKNYYADRNDSNAFPDNNISNLYEYKKGHLIFISDKVWCMNTITQQFYKINQLNGKEIESFQKSKSGKFFFSTWDTCYVSNDNLQLIDTLVPPTRFKHARIFTVELDDSTWLVGHLTELFLYSVHKNRFRPLEIRADLLNEKNALFFRYYDELHQCLYFSQYYNGLYAFSLTGQLLHHWPTGSEETDIRYNPVLTVIRKNDSLLLVGTGNGFNILNTHTNTVRHIFKQQSDATSIINDEIHSLYIDHDKNTWLATTGGISKLNQRLVYTTNWHQQFDSVDANGTLQAIAKGPNGDMYASFYLSHTYRVSTKDGLVIKLVNKDVPGAWSLDADGHNLLITGRGTTIMRYDMIMGTYTKSNFLQLYFPKSDVITTGFKHSNGDTWYSGNSPEGGFVRVEAATAVIHNYKKDGPRGKFTCPYHPYHTETANGDLWFGVNKLSILLHWNKATDYFNEINFEADPGGQNINLYGVSCLTHDKDNNIWIGFNGSGIFKYDPVVHTTHRYSIHDGLPTDRVSSLVFDASNRLWISHFKGLTCLLLDAQKFVSFKKEDGLPYEPSEESCSFFDTATNKLWIGTGVTLTSFNPDSLLAAADRHFPIYLDGLFVNSKNVESDYSQRLKLRPDENNIQFQFVAVDINNVGDLEYSYRLIGADKDWIHNGSITSVSYANLNPGDYKFIARARHKGNNLWIKMEVPFSFHIQTPWNKSWWFILMLISVAGLLTWAIFRAYYLRKLESQKAVIEKQNAISKERSRIAADMHDDMGAGLSRMRYLSANLKKETQDEKEKIEFDKLITGSDELVDKMNEIIWTLNNNDGHLEELLYHIRSQCSQILDSANIKFIYNLPVSIPAIIVSSEQKRNLSLVVKETVHNAIKHSGATQVGLEMLLQEGLKISITDNGKGFEPTRLKPGGNGLHNYQKRMTALNGTVTIQSGNVGTTVTFQVPVP